ncbi:MAG: asparagine synthase (glutamine-hydrolyzing) [Saprospiraceae bacterium]
MCGITGIAGPWTSVDRQRRATIAHMTNLLAHRGPDAEGFYESEKVALGHRRLSIIDLSEAANQPMSDATGRYTIVFNGEVYNYREVKQQLSGYPFRTNCDTEVVLAAYIKWGPACLERFNGMFAIAIWDDEEESLFLVRDRLGIKPLYYAHRGEQLFFASEIRALIHGAGLEKALDRRSLARYLAFQAVHPPETLVEGIRQLRPAEYAIFRNGKIEKKRYWEPQVQGPLIGDCDQARKQVRELLGKAVERRMISDVPLGAFLSGGIDSSAIVALMAQASERPVETFSVVFEEQKFDESAFSGQVAQRFKTNHHPILLRPDSFLESLPDALAAMDTPSGDAINTYVVSKVTKAAGITVALSGLGGDELFMGYGPYFKSLRLGRLPLFWHLPVSLRKMAMKVAATFMHSHQGEKLQEIADAAGNSAEQLLPSFRKVLTDASLRKMGLEPPQLNGLLQQNSKLPVFSRITLADLALYTQDVLLKDTDQMSMAHALEVRVPFFDHELVECALRISDPCKRPDYPKKLLVEALGDLLPKEVVFRKKQGFDLPWKVWMKGALKQFCEARLNRLRARNLFDFGQVNAMWQEFLSGRNDTLWSRIWVLVVLEDWLERNLD